MDLRCTRAGPGLNFSGPGPVKIWDHINGPGRVLRTPGRVGPALRGPCRSLIWGSFFAPQKEIVITSKLLQIFEANFTCVSHVWSEIWKYFNFFPRWRPTWSLKFWIECISALLSNTETNKVLIRLKWRSYSMNMWKSITSLANFLRWPPKITIMVS